MAAKKKPAPKRGASRYQAPAKKPVPGWVWLACGAAVGAFFMFLFSLEPGRDEVKRSKPEEQKRTAAQQQKPQVAAEPAKPKYDFYTLLPESEVIVPPDALPPADAPKPPEQKPVTPEEAAKIDAARAEAALYGQWLSAQHLPHYAHAAKPPRPDAPLRVGLVSGDLRYHPVGFFLESLVPHLAAAGIALFAYPTWEVEDSVTVRLKPYCTGWQPLSGLSDAAAAACIYADQLDVLLDLAGHSRHNRLPVFAYRPAPVQGAWLGYFATTGLAEMDFVLVDKMGVPPAAQAYFTEHVRYLPETRLCFTPPDTTLPVAALVAYHEGVT